MRTCVPRDCAAQVWVGLMGARRTSTRFTCCLTTRMCPQRTSACASAAALACPRHTLLLTLCQGHCGQHHRLVHQLGHCGCSRHRHRALPNIAQKNGVSKHSAQFRWSQCQFKSRITLIFHSYASNNNAMNQSARKSASSDARGQVYCSYSCDKNVAEERWDLSARKENAIDDVHDT